MLLMAGAVTGGHFGLLPVRFLSRPIGATVLLANMSGRMGGNQRATLRIAAARITVSPLAVTRLATTGRRHGGWIGGIRCDDSLWLFTGSRRRLMGGAFATGTPTPLSFARFGIRLESRYIGGTGRNIRGNIMRQHSNVTGFTVTPVFLATTGSLRFPFVCHRRPLFRRLWAVSGVDHCLVHFAAHKRRRYAAGFHKVSLGGQYQRKRF
jgi:hypothetical protein